MRGHRFFSRTTTHLSKVRTLGNACPWRPDSCVAVTGRGSPDRIRTGVTGLRGRRPRPLDDGANKAEEYSTLARGEGLEPSITGPEPVVLPITPPPRASLRIAARRQTRSERFIGCRPPHRCSRPACHGPLPPRSEDDIGRGYLHSSRRFGCWPVRVRLRRGPRPPMCRDRIRRR